MILGHRNVFSLRILVKWKERGRRGWERQEEEGGSRGGGHLGEEKAMDKVDRFMCTRTTLKSWVREI